MADGDTMKPRLNQRIQFSLAYVLVAAMVLLLLQSWLQAPRTVEIPMSRFLELVRADKVEKVALTEKEIRGIAKPDALPTTPSGPGDRLRQWLGSDGEVRVLDRKSTRLNSSHLVISYAVFCLKKKKKQYKLSSWT